MAKEILDSESALEVLCSKEEKVNLKKEGIKQSI